MYRTLTSTATTYCIWIPFIYSCGTVLDTGFGVWSYDRLCRPYAKGSLVETLERVSAFDFLPLLRSFEHAYHLYHVVEVMTPLRAVQSHMMMAEVMTLLSNVLSCGGINGPSV